MLFSERSVWTMVHGIGLGGAALLGLAAALFYLYTTRPEPRALVGESGARAFALLTTFTAVTLWLTVITRPSRSSRLFAGAIARTSEPATRYPSTSP